MIQIEFCPKWELGFRIVDLSWQVTGVAGRYAVGAAAVSATTPVASAAAQAGLDGGAFGSSIAQGSDAATVVGRIQGGEPEGISDTARSVCTTGAGAVGWT